MRRDRHRRICADVVQHIAAEQTWTGTISDKMCGAITANGREDVGSRMRTCLVRRFTYVLVVDGRCIN